MATEKIVTFRDLDVWRESHSLVLDIYTLTGKLPAEERFGLAAQMRRAAISVPANIAEGFKRKGQKDKCNFYNVAASSLEELRYYLILAEDLKYTDDSEELEKKCSHVARMLAGLTKSVARDLRSTKGK
jgi:four helix bundle protein